MGKQQFFFRWTTYSFIARPVLTSLFLELADWMDGQMTWVEKLQGIDWNIKLLNKSMEEEESLSLVKVVLLSFIKTRAKDSFDCNVIWRSNYVY